MTTNARILRDASLAAAFEGKSFEIVARVALPSDSPKFAAYVTGARGRNGYVIKDLATDAEYVTGWQTVQDAADLGAITGMVRDRHTNGYVRPSMKNVITNIDDLPAHKAIDVPATDAEASMSTVDSAPKAVDFTKIDLGSLILPGTESANVETMGGLIIATR